MGLSCACLTVIVFCLTPMIVEAFGDLMLLRHPSSKNSGKRLLTCLSGDDDSALVWNYNCQTNGTNRGVNIINDFPPKILGSKNMSECAIWNSVTCIANWEQPFQWDVVNSDKKPTSPVFDYRWEGFKEFVFEDTIAGHKYVDTGNVEGNSGTVVFSVRALQDVNIYLCKKKSVEKNRCFWINIGREHGRQSKIFTCVGGALKPGANEECEVIAETGHESIVVDAYEWRTFRIEWKSEEQTVKLFKETELEPFLVGIVQKWHNVSHIFLSSEISSRVRFHFYDYILTEKKNTELFTQQFRQESRDFCVELLVGLCSNCQLTVRLIDESGHPIATNSISGNKDSANSALLSWKSIKLVKSLKGSMPKFVKIKIQTILNGTKGTGQWAVDNFRVCKLDGSLRSSTITTREEKASSDLWPIVRCQKISYSESAIVDSLSKNKIHRETSRLRQLFRKTQLFHSYKMSIEKWFICNPTGCACDRGYKSADCATQCSGGSYGYDCNESCGSCSSGNCDVVNGNCNTGCRSDRLLPPLCKEIEQPIIEDITDTTARLFQKVEPELSTYIIDFRHVITESSGKGSGSILSSTVNVGSTFTINFKQLRPGTTYRVHTIVTTQFEHTFENPKIGGNVTVQSPEINFTTTRQRCMKVVPNKNSIDLSLQRDVNLEGCEAFSNSPYHIEVKGSANFVRDYGLTYLPLRCKNLDPYTEYELFVSRDGIPLWTKKVRTLPSAPEKVRNLHSQYLSDTKVILQWYAPLKINGVIIKYSVSIKRITLRGCQELGKPTPVQDETIKEVKDTIASFSGLNPYAEYRATVIAHTTEPGSENTIKFQTPEADIQTSVVTNLKLINNQTRLKWDKPQDCLKITASIKLTRLVFTGVSDWVKNWTTSTTTTLDYFDLYQLFLTHSYTTYNVRVYVLKSNGLHVNPDLYGEMNWTTAPTAPSAVKSLEEYDADPDTNTISLRWKPPKPANGEIESYHVTIAEASPIKEWTMYASDGKLMCELWENYVCYENITLPPNVDHEIRVTVSAKNRNVSSAGISTTNMFNRSSVYNKVPASPIILQHESRSHGIVKFNWKHPFSKIKITEFYISLKFKKTNLYYKKNIDFPLQPINYTFIQKSKNYSIELHLETSTTYVISITSKHRNKFSRISNTTIEVPYEFGFIDGNKLEVNKNGSKINLKVPPVINATCDTTVNVILSGSLNCTRNHIEISSSIMNMTELIIAKYNTSKKTPSRLTIDINHINIDNYNCSLYIGETYDIKVVVKAMNDTILATIACESISLTDNDLNLLWFIVIIPIILIFLIPLIIWLRKSRRISRRKSAANKFQKGARNTYNMMAFLTKKNSKLSTGPMKNENSDNVYDVLYATDSRLVTTDYFSEYTKTAASSGQLFSQYMTFPRDLTKPCEYGKLPENMPKNKNQNLIPYDDTRVVLQKIPDDPYSDYINASYIQGNRGEKAYIATQDPLPHTINDFWRMIWQEKVYVICMLTNVTKNGEKNYEQYWPEIGLKVKYGDVSVLITNLQVFADYSIRNFRISCQKYKRKITQLHYTSWPDQGIPTYSRSLVEYLNIVMDTPTGNGPVVVHCSTGGGRTGTLILCDICLRQALEEKVIDMVAATTQMRKSRANMVGCLQQYLLAHIVIMESITESITHIVCDDDFSEGIKRLKKQLPIDIQRLNDTAWQERMLYSLVTPRPPTPGDFGINQSAKLDSVICPNEIYFERYSKLDNERSIYISAVSVDGVKTKKQYLASELPSKSTWCKFWLLIAKQNVQLIIILQRADPKDPTCCDIIPKKSTFAPMPHILVETQEARQTEDHFTTEKLLLTDTSGDERRPQLVTVLTCTGWGQGKTGKPPNPAALVSLWLASNKIPRKKGISLVLCRDGVTGCGLYLALSFLLERMSVEKECDVISAVRTVRRFRPEFVQNLDEFEYLYDAAVNYVDCFATYANFS